MNFCFLLINRWCVCVHNGISSESSKHTIAITIENSSLLILFNYGFFMNIKKEKRHSFNIDFADKGEKIKILSIIESVRTERVKLFLSFFRFLFIFVKNVNNKFFLTRYLVPSFYAQKKCEQSYIK